MFSSSSETEKEEIFKNKISDITSEFNKIQSDINDNVTNTPGFAFLHLEGSISNINRDANNTTNGYIGHMYRVYHSVHSGEDRNLDGILLSIVYSFDYFENGSYIEPSISIKLLREPYRDKYNTIQIGEEYDLDYYKESTDTLKNELYYQKLNDGVVFSMIKDIISIHPSIKEDYKEIISLVYRINNTIRNFIDSINKDGEYVKLNGRQ